MRAEGRGKEGNVWVWCVEGRERVGGRVDGWVGGKLVWWARVMRKGQWARGEGGGDGRTDWERPRQRHTQREKEREREIEVCM